MVPGGGGDGTADLRGGGRGGGGTTGDWLRDSGTADLGGGRRGGGGSLLHTCAWRTGLCNDLVSRKFRPRGTNKADLLDPSPRPCQEQTQHQGTHSMSWCLGYQLLDSGKKGGKGRLLNYLAKSFQQ
ncbi:hapless 2-like isoform X5 [Corvus hawaiiensis]|uniref:hapless 2-like isoform X5 n=1 Tax=Corvus hawaiiensis TaxID=134902 RepID=UPI0020188B2B|nr:hapless 2-like isoform X5 [Corvus hawaiiensis]